MVKISSHTGRANKKKEVFDCAHNDRTAKHTKKGGAHIKEEYTPLNSYKNIYLDNTMSFKAVEKRFYQEMFGEGLARKNEAYKRDGHSEHCKTIDDMLSSPRTAPIETIFQLSDVKTFEAVKGYFNSRNSALMFYKAILTDAFKMFLKTYEKYGENLFFLDWASHFDEQGAPHIHSRYLFSVLKQMKDGTYEREINQKQALKNMGYSLPDPTAKEDRRNNLKMSFEADIHETWSRCIKQSLGRYKERHPEHSSLCAYLSDINMVAEKGQKHLEHNEYVLKMQREEIEKNAKYIKYQKEFEEFVRELEAENEDEMER